MKKSQTNWISKAAVIFIAAATASFAADTSRPNVLFIAVDDLRPELGCYGKDYIKSPNIDGLAKSGMVFNRAYCQQAVCSPSRTCVMTGVRPDTSKVWDLVTHFRTALPKVVTLGQQFKANGYFVQGMGKIYHGGYDDPPTWSVPWQNPKAPVYALPENIALSQEKVAGEPDGVKGDNSGADPKSYSVPPDNTAGKKSGKKGKGKKGEASGTSEGGKANSRGPIYECADVPDNTYTDGKVADLAVQTLRNSLMSATMTASTAMLGLIGTVTLAAPSLHASFGWSATLPSFTPRLVLELLLLTWGGGGINQSKFYAAPPLLKFYGRFSAAILSC